MVINMNYKIAVCDDETIKLYESEILYVESFRHYITIQAKDKEYKIISSRDLQGTETLNLEGYYDIISWKQHRKY